MNNTYLDKLILKNFMGYRDTTFDFFNKEGKRKPICLFYGPNGTGKSTVLTAIMLACNSPRLVGRDNSLGFMKLVFSEDLDLPYQALKIKAGEATAHTMNLLAHFQSDNQSLQVELDNKGVVKCDLPKAGIGYYIDADNQMNLAKFQFAKGGYDKEFLEMARIIYHFPCEFNKESGTLNDQEGSLLSSEVFEFYTDFIVTKYGVRSHFKSMSGGEKKIATMLAQILDPSYIDPSSIIVIDSFEKEIYFKRQGRAVDKMLETFPDKQFFIATHSESLINHVKDKYGEDCLYDIEEYKIKDLGLTEGYIN